MKLAEYSLDDLHLLATAEFDEDPQAQQLLNDIYASFVSEYAEVIRDLRERAVR